MLRRSFAVVLVNLLLGFVSAAAQVDSPPAEQPQPTKYEKFLQRTDKLIVTKSYPLGDLPGGGGFKIFAQVAWALDEKEKVYAANISGRTVDFEQLQGMLDGVDKMQEGIDGLFDKLEATSMFYSSPAGLNVSYYTYTDGSGAPRRTLYMKIGSYVRQNPKTESLRELRDLIAQARAKLVELGAQTARSR